MPLFFFTKSTNDILLILLIAKTRRKERAIMSTTILRGVLEDSDGNILYFENNSDMIKHNSTTVNAELTALDNKMTVYPTTHSGNDYSVTVPGITALTDLTDGYPLTVKFDANSTGNITLNPNGLKAISVVDYFGAPVLNVRQNLIANLRYEITSGNFQLLGKGGDGTAISAHLLLNDTATVSSGKITGSMPNNGAETQVTSVKALTNLVSNGNFNSGLATGWGTPINGGTLSINSNTSFGTFSKFGSIYSMALSSTASSSETYTEYSLPYIQGHKYYCSVWVYSLVAGKTSELYWPETAPYPMSNVTCVNANTWYQNSFISNNSAIASGTYKLRVDNNNANTAVYMAFDGFTVIDLTAAYGAGLEPTKAQMDALINSLGGYFDGTTIVGTIPLGAYLTTGSTGGTEVITNSTSLVPLNIIGNAKILGVQGGIPVNPGLISGSNHIEAAGTSVGKYSPDGVQRLYVRPGIAAARQVIDGDMWISKEEPNLIPSNFLNTVSMFGLQGGIPVYKNAVQAGSQAYYGSQTAIYITPPTGYHEGSNIYIQDANYIAANIVYPAKVFGVQGSATVQSLGGTILHYASGTAMGTVGGYVSYYNYIDLSGIGFDPQIITGALSNGFKFSFVRNLNNPMSTWYKWGPNYSGDDSGDYYVAVTSTAPLNQLTTVYFGMTYGTPNYKALSANWEAWGW